MPPTDQDAVTHPGEEVAAASERPSTDPRRERRGCGCYFKGCLVTLILGGVVAGGLAYWGWSRYETLVQDYTATEPVVIPVVEIDRREMQRLEMRLQAFEAAIAARPALDPEAPFRSPEATPGARPPQSDSEAADRSPDLSPLARPSPDAASPPASRNRARGASPDSRPVGDSGDRRAVDPATLVLTAGDLNALIAKSPKYRGRVLTRIVDGKIQARVSLPVDQVPNLKDLPGVEGRFFNGTVTVEASKKGDAAVLRILKAVIKGKPMPPPWMERLRSQNLADQLARNPKARKIMDKIDSVEVADDSIVIKLRD